MDCINGLQTFHTDLDQLILCIEMNDMAKKGEQMAANYKLIGSRIQNRRKELKITQAQMAELLEVSTGYISQIERGATKINLDILCQIGEFLDCDVTEFLFKNNVPKMSFYEDDIVKDYQQLSDKEREMLARLLREYCDKR